MERYKAKSQSSEFTNEDIARGCFATSFVSFESAIRLALAEYPQVHDGKKPIGYVVTEQGIEIKFKI